MRDLDKSFNQPHIQLFRHDIHYERTLEKRSVPHPPENSHLSPNEGKDGELIENKWGQKRKQ